MHDFWYIQTWDLIDDGRIRSAACRIKRKMSDALPLTLRSLAAYNMY